MIGGNKRRTNTLERLASLRQREAEHLSVELQSMRGLRENAERAQTTWQMAVQQRQAELLEITETRRTLDIDAFFRQRLYLADCRLSLVSATKELETARGHEERISDKIKDRWAESKAMESVIDRQRCRLEAAERSRGMAISDDQFLMKLAIDQGRAL